jgi:threonine synthase
MAGPIYSYLSHLECARCATAHDADVPQNLCHCGSPLLARYDLAALAGARRFEDMTRRAQTLWRYHELLPVRSPAAVVSMGEGMTPLISLPRLGEDLGVPRLLIKDEGLIPSGTFKTRGAAVGVSRARELGVSRVAMPTNGNAGAAWSAYAARAGLASLVVMPVDAPLVTRSECAATGARLYLVEGRIGDAGAIVAGVAGRDGWFDVATLKEPYRLEGKKTMALEVFEQLGCRMPDVIVYPTGGGVGLIGIHKALQELGELGWLDPEPPRLVAVQAAGCAPIVRAWERGEGHVEPWPDAATIAFGINVARPLGDFLILEALYATGGCAVAVEDAELLREIPALARREGVFACPEGAATVAAVRRLRASGWLDADDEVLLLNTGSGLKYPETVVPEPPVLRPGDEVPIAGG